jgi:hypothetical protein
VQSEVDMKGVTSNVDDPSAVDGKVEPCARSASPFLVNVAEDFQNRRMILGSGVDTSD